MIHLKLYIAGQTERSKQIITRIESILSETHAHQFQLETIDVIQEPTRAETDKVIATPTLIKSLPEPVRRLIGDLKDKERVLAGLELQ